MRSNGHNSKRGTRNSNGGDTSAATINGGHGTDVAAGDGDGRGDAAETESWFEPVNTEEVMDCPGGVCPVPWAKKEELDNVNHPSHYNSGQGVECIEAIESQLTPEEYRGYLKGCIAKYIWREKYKGGIESLQKAQWYLTRLIELE